MFQSAFEHWIVELEFEDIARGHRRDRAVHRKRTAEHRALRGQLWRTREPAPQIRWLQQSVNRARLIETALTVGAAQPRAHRQLIPMRGDIGIKPGIATERLCTNLLRYRHAIRLYFTVRMIGADGDQRAEWAIEQHAFDFADRVRTEHGDAVVLREQASGQAIETRRG